MVAGFTMKRFHPSHVHPTRREGIALLGHRKIDCLIKIDSDLG
jgi:hypothetical protein